MLPRLARRAVEVVRREGLLAAFGKVPYHLTHPVLDRLEQLLAPHLATEIRNLPEDSSLRTLLAFAFGRRLIRPQQVRAEIEGLLAATCAGGPPRVVMEIGTANGGNLFLLTRSAAADATVVSVDLPGGDFGGGYPAWKTSLYQSFPRRGQQLHLLRADSHAPATVAAVRDLLPAPVDLLFVDGDHTEAGVRQDYLGYRPLVRPGGVIAFHDIATPIDRKVGVHRFWHAVRDGAESREFVADPHQGWAGIGMLRLPPG